MGKEKYYPLAFLSASDTSGREFEARKEQFMELGLWKATEYEEEEYIRFMMSGDFLDTRYKGKYKGINMSFRANTPSFIETLRIPMEDIRSGKYDIRTEWRDYYLQPVIWDRWARNKQVYKPDPLFAEALSHTDRFQITKNQLVHEPTNCLYMDLQDVPIFGKVKGILVFFLFLDEETVSFSMSTLTDDLYSFTFYFSGRFDKEGIIEIDIDQFDRRGYDVYTQMGDGKLQSMENCMGRVETILFAMQMLCYLSSKEPDIDESPQTRRTYKKSGIVRNRFSEVQSWDVGVRYGNRVRVTVKEAVRNYKEEAEALEADIKSPTLRKAPVPHFRSAHWQRYWTGVGRTTCEVRWIEPVFVGLRDSTPDVVIHRIG